MALGAEEVDPSLAAGHGRRAAPLWSAPLLDALDARMTAMSCCASPLLPGLNLECPRGRRGGAPALAQAFVKTEAWRWRARPDRDYSQLLEYVPRPGFDAMQNIELTADTCRRSFEFLNCVVDSSPYGVEFKHEPGTPVEVISVAAGSLAEQAAVCIGDVLVEIEGRVLVPDEDLGSALQVPMPYSLTFLRPGPPDHKGGD
mmetsp:Transcript_56969/g.161756  ORF Transcript_56969/g.161756 Transcript_56969/m.161756 type:complete len:201 (-) Transcript_56969:347-949(-)